MSLTHLSWSQYPPHTPYPAGRVPLTEPEGTPTGLVSGRAALSVGSVDRARWPGLPRGVHALGSLGKLWSAWGRTTRARGPGPGLHTAPARTAPTPGRPGAPALARERLFGWCFLVTRCSRSLPNPLPRWRARGGRPLWVLGGSQVRKPQGWVFSLRSKRGGKKPLLGPAGGSRSVQGTGAQPGPRGAGGVGPHCPTWGSVSLSAGGEAVVTVGARKLAGRGRQEGLERTLSSRAGRWG